MTFKQLLTKTLLVAAGLCVGASAWADRVYFNDFEAAVSGSDGLTIHGDGSFVAAADAKFGKVFQNGGGAQRTHYLQLPSDVLSHSATSKKMSIGFWVNKGNAGESSSYMWAPLFMAYGDAPTTENVAPMLACQYRGVLQYNNAGGWCDYVDCQNVAGTNTLYHNTTDWLADGEWHYYTVVFDANIASVYIDGVLKNKWNAAKEYWKLKVDPWTIVDTEPTNVGDYDHITPTQNGIYANGADLDYVCLGGNQAWNWGDNDAAFAFDDFAVYDEALTASDIISIISVKKGLNLTLETYDFSAANSTTSSSQCGYGTTVSINSTDCKILSSEKLEMNDRFAGQAANGSNWNVFRSGNGLGTSADRKFGILNLSANDYVTITYSGSAPTFIGASNISGLANGTAVISGSAYKMAAAGNLELNVPKAANSSWTYIKSITIWTSTPVLSKPAIVFDSMVESAGVYNPKFKFSSSDEGVTFYDADGNDISSGYTFTAAGTLTYYAGKAGRTNSAKQTYTINANHVGMILANSVSTSDLVGTINYETGAVLADNTQVGGAKWIIPGLHFEGSNITYRTWGILPTSGNRTVSCSVLNENRIATYQHYNYSTKATTYDYLTSASNAVSFLRKDKDNYDRFNAYALYVNPSEVISVTIGTTGYSTFSCPVPLDFSGVSGLTAYVAKSVDGENITLSSVTTAPANTGLVLKGTAGETYNIPVTNAAETPASNLLVGCIVNTTVAADATSKFNNYVLVNNGGAPEFQSLADNGATITAGKAFLKNGAYSAGARSLTFAFDNETTGIETINNEQSAMNSVFDLQGRRVDAPQKGLYIVNGKKVIMK